MKPKGPKISKEAQPKAVSSSLFNLSNEEYLVRTLKFLEITEQEYLKQTKATMEDIFPRTLLNPANSKQFFYITLKCTQYLANAEEYQNLAIWYPPKNVNEQIEFKKVFFKIIQKLESQKVLPKHLLLSKSVIMGDSPASSVIQFLRILSELALRSCYIQKFSKQERLIQVALNPFQSITDPHDPNNFYLYPFVETLTCSESPLQPAKLQFIKSVFKVHIESYRRKILDLRIVEDQNQIILNSQQIMTNLINQKQLAQELSSKIPKSLLSENRAFDRRVILDRHRTLWEDISKLQCTYVEKSDCSVLDMTGQIDFLLKSWETIQGSARVHDFNQKMKKVHQSIVKCKDKLEQIKQFNSNIRSFYRSSQLKLSTIFK